MHTRPASIAALAAALLLAPGCATTGPASESLAPAPAATPALAPFAALAGSWRAPAGTSVFEESWLPPAGGNMTGSLRSVRADGSATLFELITLTDEPEGVRMRLRHFDRELNPWASEAAGPIVLLAGPPQGDVFEFLSEDPDPDAVRSIRYDLSRPDRMVVTIAFGGSRPPIELTFDRIGGP
jgi:hypothetical protein